MIDSAEPVHCREHGVARRAFVCRHLVQALLSPPARPIGFFHPAAQSSEEEDLHGWCGACDAILLRVGEWNDESEGFAGVTMICSICYKKVSTTQGASQPA